MQQRPTCYCFIKTSVNSVPLDGYEAVAKSKPLSTKRVTRPQPIKKPCTGSVAVQLIIQISRQCSEFAVGAACVECGGKWIAKIKRLASKRSIRLISTRDCPCRSVSIVPVSGWDGVWLCKLLKTVCLYPHFVYRSIHWLRFAAGGAQSHLSHLERWLRVLSTVSPYRAA